MIKKERLDKSPDDHLCPLVKGCVLGFFFFPHSVEIFSFSHCRTDMNLLVEDIEFVSSYTPTTCSQC